MTKTRYNSGIGSKLLIGAVFLILIAAVFAMIFAFSKNEQFNSFKRELSSLSGGVKSELYTEYKGNIYEITKKISRIYILFLQVAHGRTAKAEPILPIPLVFT